jgi:F-type H+-transporting ATPase subunit gamma
MANLKQLRKRINSIGSTQKITKAMQLVSANKLSKAQDMLSENLLVLDVTNQIFANVLPVFHTQDENNNVDDVTKTLVLITSDKGLCGGYNSSIIKNFKEKLKKLRENNNTNLNIIVVGKKGRDVFKDDPDIIFYNNISHDYQYITDTIVEQIFSTVSLKSLKESADNSVVLYFNHYKNTITYKNTEKLIWPIASEELKQSNGYEVEKINFSEALRLYLKVNIINALVSSNASELSARMLAMDNATRNAKTLIEKLTLNLNRSRQAMITKELIEIISGAEAL